MIKRIFKRLMNCRNRVSVWLLGLPCAILTTLLYHELTEWHMGIAYTFGLCFLCLPLFGICCILFIVEQLLPQLKCPQIFFNNPITKGLHFLNLINIFIGIAPILYAIVVLTMQTLWEFIQSII